MSYKGIKYEKKEIPEKCRVIPGQSFTIRELFAKSQRNQQVNIHVNKDIGIGSKTNDSFEVNPITTASDLTDLASISAYNMRKLQEYKQSKIQKNENRREEQPREEQPGEN